MNVDDTLIVDILGWFRLPDGRWLRLSLENHGGLDRVQLRVCEACPNGKASSLWTSPSGPVQPTRLGISLERRTWRSIMAALKSASSTPVVDEAGVPLLERNVRERYAAGFSLREIAEIVGLSKSTIHRILGKPSVQRGDNIR